MNIQKNSPNTFYPMAPLERPRVVVVDDDPIIGCVLAGALNRGGFDVEIFNNGAEALSAFDQTGTDMVVVDWIMPGLDGLTLIDALKDKCPELPTMLITSYDGHDTVQEAMRGGRVDAVLSKPFDLRKFIDTVSSFVYKENGRSEFSGMPQAAEARPLAALGHVSHYQYILENLIDAVLMVDQSGRIVYHNRGADRMFGLSALDDDGPHSIQRICPDGSPVPEALSLFFKPHPPVGEQNKAYFRRYDGSDFYAIFSISLFDPPNYQEPTALVVVKDIHEHHLAEREISEKAKSLELLAITDPLTGIYNRRHFDRRLDEEFKRMERYNSPLTLIMLDFDRFKVINDFFGHLVGDKVLGTSARMLTEGLREVDVLARWGGEEFTILLPETNAETGFSVAKRLHGLIGRSDQWARISPDLNVTISMGVVSLPWATKSPDLGLVLKNLDKALYRAKESGRNCIVFYRDLTDDFKIIC